jgi:hypothetical protein
MARSKQTPGSGAYYDATQRIFSLQSEILTAVLPHAGERGANDEERCRNFLHGVLPRRYSLGTGFIVSSEPESVPSPQQDIVIFDEFTNSPLHQELSASIFPIEIVYGTVEVKGRLQPDDLVPTLESIAKTRQLSMRCWYERVAKPKDKPTRYVQFEQFCVKHAPRAFVFAFDTTYSASESLKNALEVAIDKVKNAHLHGIVVLSKDWFAFQVAYQQPPKVKIFTDNALMRYVNNMLRLLKALPMYNVAMDRYLGIETAPPDDVGESHARIPRGESNNER